MFDSLGLNEDEVKFRLGQIAECNFNESAVQGQNSERCGGYALYFAFVRLANLDLDFDDVLNTYFVQSVEDNEKIVRHFLQTGNVHDQFASIPHPKKTQV